MPLKRCRKNGESGRRWGSEGKCYTGKDARAKAKKQARAIKASQESKSGSN